MITDPAKSETVSENRPRRGRPRLISDRVRHPDASHRLVRNAVLRALDAVDLAAEDPGHR